MPTYAAVGLAQIGVFLFKEGSECEKGESRPLKDRLCPGTTLYSQSIESAAGGDYPSLLAGPSHIEGKVGPARRRLDRWEIEPVTINVSAGWKVKGFGLPRWAQMRRL